MAITEHQLSKLPKYVQEHIKALESEIKRLKDSLDQMGGSVQSDISWTGLGIGGYLPSRATVRFGTYPDGIEVTGTGILAAFGSVQTSSCLFPRGHLTG